jgi:inorganic pyrophosphatase
MTEDCVELQVDFPGKEYARVDYDPSTGKLKLQEVVYPETYLPADLCSLPNTCTEETTELPALLIRKIALPPGCRVPARPIGLCLMTDGKASQSIPLFVPSGDAAFAKVDCLEDLPEKEQIQITDFLKSNEAEPWDLII